MNETQKKLNDIIRQIEDIQEEVNGNLNFILQKAINEIDYVLHNIK